MLVLVFFFNSRQEDKMVEEDKMVGPLISLEDKMVAFSSSLDGCHLNQSIGCYMKKEALQQRSSSCPTYNNHQPPSQGHHQNHQGDQTCIVGTNGHKQQTPGPPTNNTPPIQHPHQSKDTCAHPKYRYEQLFTEVSQIRASQRPKARNLARCWK